MAYRLTREELIGQLADQLSFLKASGPAFDAGAIGEAKRLATTIRVLLHDTAQSQSLMTLLKLKASLRYVDTALPINPANMLSTPGLVIMRMTSGGADGEGGGEYMPACATEMIPTRTNQPPRQFADWWETPVTKDQYGELFSRKQYVLTVANKEGGAHVDPKLNEAYAALTRENSLGFMYLEQSPNEGISVEKPYARNPALASVRQIAFELESTLEDQLPKLLGEAWHSPS